MIKGFFLYKYHKQQNKIFTIIMIIDIMIQKLKIVKNITNRKI